MIHERCVQYAAIYYLPAFFLPVLLNGTSLYNSLVVMLNAASGPRLFM